MSHIRTVFIVTVNYNGALYICDQLMELQEQTMSYARDLRGVTHAIASVQRELRSVAVTAQQINTYEPTVPLYRAVGKCFLLSPRDTIEDHLAKEAEKLDKNQKDLDGRREYLERRIASNRSNMTDITSSVSAPISA